MNIPGIPPVNAHAQTQMTINPPTAFHAFTPGDAGNNNIEDQPLPPQSNFDLSRARQARNSNRVPNVSQRDREKEEQRRRRRRARPNNQRSRQTECKHKLFQLSLTYFAQKYYGKWLTKTPVKATVLVLCAIQLILATYGTMKINKGLELADMLPKNTTQHEYMVKRQKYFSYYKIYVITRSNEDGSLFDYANNQELVYELHRKLSKVKNMVYSPNKFWLPIYRDWLKEWHNELVIEWKNRTMNLNCAPNCKEAQMETRKIYKLLSTSLTKIDPDHDDCSLPKNAKKSEIIKRVLVDNKGIINPELFYLGLSLWHYEDSLGLWESEVEIEPEPKGMYMKEECKKYPEVLKAAPEYMTMGFQVHNLRNSDDYIQLIKDVRKICDEFKKRGLYSYPIGIPFTYWEQFVSLDSNLSVAICVVLVSTFLICLLCLMNIKAAFFIVAFLGIILFEAFGFIGICNIQLSAISIIPLMMSMGTGTQFVVHSVMAFINTPGNRNRRMRGSLEIMFASVFDCCMSSIIMISLLASSQYDFIVKYFFQLMLWIIIIAMFNTLLVLPVMLSLCGPCLEKIHKHNAITPVLTPTYFLNFPGNVDDWCTVDYNRRNTLSTIPEENSCLNGEPNSRPGTPAHKMGNSVSSPYGSKSTMRNSVLTVNDCDVDEENDEYSETSFDNASSYTSRRAPTPAAWMHNPSLQNNRQQRGCGRVPQTNYRDLPPNNRAGSSNAQNRTNGNNNRAERGRQTPAQTFAQMQDNRVTTKVKTTMTMELEISHPNSPFY